MQKVSLAQQLFDECDNRSNKKLAMIANIYVNHQTELQDYVTNIALIFFLNIKTGILQLFVSKPSSNLFLKLEIIWYNQLLIEQICFLTAGWQKPMKSVEGSVPDLV